MQNTRPISRRPSKVHHRPPHWNSREIKEAFAFWLGFEAVLNLLNLCGVGLIRWLREAAESELLPGVMVALALVVIYTPASRYGILLHDAKGYTQQLGQTILKLRVEQILKFLIGHHMRMVLLWSASMACIHLTVGYAKSVFYHPSDTPTVRAPVDNTPRQKTPQVTPSDAHCPAALAYSNDQ